MGHPPSYNTYPTWWILSPDPLPAPFKYHVGIMQLRTLRQTKSKRWLREINKQNIANGYNIILPIFRF